MATDLFGYKYNEGLVHQAVVAYMAAGRAGTKAQKTRSEVRGGGRKPWRQKGTGRARAGTIRSPLWRGGGVTFAAKPRSFKQKLNKKMYKGALRSIFSELNRQGLLKIVEQLTCTEPKTKQLLEQLKQLDISNALIITDAVDTNLYLSARNIPMIEVLDVQAINPVALLKYEKVIITNTALKLVEEQLG